MSSVIHLKDYYDKVYGCWLGKNIGGTLGGPVEGKKELLDLKFYPKLGDGPMPNDDLDLQLVWLHALEQYGAKLDERHLGKEWLDHVFFPFDEYGYGLANLRRGLEPPVSGYYNNPFIDCMGSPIRSEIWAMVAPGCPGLAVHYAVKDAVVDHAGGEGVYGEMFFAAIESAAFAETDPQRLIAIGLSYIPEQSRTARAVRDLLSWHATGVDWTEARRLVLEHHGHDNFTDAPQNIAFTLLGWLYGDSFEDAILKAVNCGYDTDCTAATLGAILGIILGPDRLPAKWVEPVGDLIAVSPAVNGFPAPANLDELTRRTIRAGREAAATWDLPVQFSSTEPTRIGPELAEAFPKERITLPEPGQWRCLLPHDTREQAALELVVDYAGSPSIARNESKTLLLSLTNHLRVPWRGSLSLELPEGWRLDSVDGLEQITELEIEAGETRKLKLAAVSGPIVRPSYRIRLHLNRVHHGLAWSTETADIGLVPASHWRIGLPGEPADREVTAPGNVLDFSRWSGQSGVYSASAILNVPSSREAVLIAETDCPVVVKLNGETVIDCGESRYSLPAFHRSYKGRRAELSLEAGRHRLELEMKAERQPPIVYVMTVGRKKPEEPGANPYHIDVTYE